MRTLMICRKLLCPLHLLKIICVVAFSASMSLYSNEIDRTLFRSDLRLTTKVTMALDLAMKKYDGQKIWLIYTIDCQRKISEGQIKPVQFNGVMTIEQIISGETYIQSNHSSENNKLKQNVLVSPEQFNQIPLNDKIQLLSNDQKKSAHSSLAIILDYSLESGNPCLYHIYFQRMDKPFFTDERPIFWLGTEISTHSYEWLVLQFHKTRYLKLKQEIISVIGVHNCTELVVEFLKQIVLNNSYQSLKEEAIYWLGQHQSIENIRFLAFLAIKQKNVPLRKKAIFALSQIKDKKARAIVATLARKEKKPEVRQEAIFWLSQIADDEALNTLNEILTNDKDSVMRDYTIFAISQLPASKSTPILYRIARTNPDVQIRNKAKFWLDRSKNQRMMDFFMDLVDEDNRCGSN